MTPAIHEGAPIVHDEQSAAPGVGMTHAGDAARTTALDVRADANGNVSPSQLILAALDRGVPADALEKLVALQERMEDRNARKEFARALAKFKSECPPIRKSKHVSIEGRSGTYGYDYAPLEEALPVMAPYLESNGFVVKWDRTADKGMVTSVCTLRHIGGHSETSSFTLPTESANPGMSIQQKYGGAATFADRKALFAVLGVVGEKEDAAARREIDPTLVTDDQLTALEDRLAARLSGKTPPRAAAWTKKFLDHFHIESLSQLRAAQYREAIAALEPQQGASS